MHQFTDFRIIWYIMVLYKKVRESDSTPLSLPKNTCRDWCIAIADSISCKKERRTVFLDKCEIWTLQRCEGGNHKKRKYVSSKVHTIFFSILLRKQELFECHSRWWYGHFPVDEKLRVVFSLVQNKIWEKRINKNKKFAFSDCSIY